MQDGIAQAGIVTDPVRCQRYSKREKRSCQAPSLQRLPHPFVIEAGRVLSGHHRIAAMEMITVGVGQIGDHDFASFCISGRGLGEAGELLQDSQRFELQRVKFKRVFFGAMTCLYQT